MLKDKDKEAELLLRRHHKHGVDWRLFVNNPLLMALVVQSHIRCSDALVQVVETENTLKITPHRSPGLSIQKQLPNPVLRATAERAGCKFMDPIGWAKYLEEYENDERIRRRRRTF